MCSQEFTYVELLNDLKPFGSCIALSLTFANAGQIFLF